MGTKNFNSATDLITFTRASGGTALRKISYGSELVTNGTFDTDLSGWNNDGTTSAIVGNQIEVTSVSGVSGSGVNQTITTVAGKRYKFSSDHAPQTGRARIEVKDNNNFGSGLETLSQTSATGTYEFVFVALSNSTYIRLEAFDTSSVVLFDNISVKEVLYDQPDGTLQLWNHGNNVPRIEYDATGAVKGLLIEETRTNLYRNSNQFVSPWSQIGSTTTASAGTSPSGLADAWRWVGNGTSILYQDTPYVAGDYTVSAWVKSNGAGEDTFRLYALNGIVSAAISGDFTATSEWVRYSHTFTSASAVNQFSGILYGASRENVDLLVYGLQIEAGSFPTSYIPTTGSSATRAKDVAFIPVSDFGYNHKAGTVLVEFKSNKPLSEQFGAFVLHDGTPNNRIMHMTVPNHRGYVRTDSGTQADIAGGNRGATSELVKFALAFAEDDFAATSNGSSPAPDISGTVPSGITRLALGNWYQSYLGSYLNGHIKSIKYYPRRLTNTQLQELTT